MKYNNKQRSPFLPHGPRFFCAAASVALSVNTVSADSNFELDKLYYQISGQPWTLVDESERTLLAGARKLLVADDQVVVSVPSSDSVLVLSAERLAEGSRIDQMINGIAGARGIAVNRNGTLLAVASENSSSVELYRCDKTGSKRCRWHLARRFGSEDIAENNFFLMSAPTELSFSKQSDTLAAISRTTRQVYFFSEGECGQSLCYQDKLDLSAASEDENSGFGIGSDIVSGIDAGRFYLSDYVDNALYEIDSGNGGASTASQLGGDLDSGFTLSGPSALVVDQFNARLMVTMPDIGRVDLYDTGDNHTISLVQRFDDLVVDGRYILDSVSGGCQTRENDDASSFIALGSSSNGVLSSFYLPADDGEILLRDAVQPSSFGYADSVVDVACSTDDNRLFLLYNGQVVVRELHARPLSERGGYYFEYDYGQYQQGDFEIGTLNVTDPGGLPLNFTAAEQVPVVWKGQVLFWSANEAEVQPVLDSGGLNITVTASSAFNLSVALPVEIVVERPEASSVAFPEPSPSPSFSPTPSPSLVQIDSDGEKRSISVGEVAGAVGVAGGIISLAGCVSAIICGVFWCGRGKPDGQVTDLESGLRNPQHSPPAGFVKPPEVSVPRRPFPRSYGMADFGDFLRGHSSELHSVLETTFSDSENMELVAVFAPSAADVVSTDPDGLSVHSAMDSPSERCDGSPQMKENEIELEPVENESEGASRCCNSQPTESGATPLSGDDEYSKAMRMVNNGASQLLSNPKTRAAISHLADKVEWHDGHTYSEDWREQQWRIKSMPASDESVEPIGETDDESQDGESQSEGEQGQSD